MKIRVLGCHGSDSLLEPGAGAPACRACGFLVDETILVDAGTIGAALTFSEQKRIRYILISHLHFDHIQGLPTLADSLFDDPARPVVLVSIPEVLKGLHTHIFNGHVYPDFTQLPNRERPVFQFLPVEPCRPVEIGKFRVTAVPVNHQVPTVGFLIDDGVSGMLYSGDTYETAELWRLAREMPTLKAAFIEASFPNAMGEVAKISQHLTPTLFAEEFRKIGRPDLAVYPYHLKPRFRDTLRRELQDLGISKLEMLEEGLEVVL